MARYGFHIEGIEFDLLLASYIVNPATTYTDVASIAREFGYMEVQQDETVYGKGAKESSASRRSYC